MFKIKREYLDHPDQYPFMGKFAKMEEDHLTNKERYSKWYKKMQDSKKQSLFQYQYDRMNS